MPAWSKLPSGLCRQGVDDFEWMIERQNSCANRSSDLFYGVALTSSAIRRQFEAIHMSGQSPS